MPAAKRSVCPARPVDHEAAVRAARHADAPLVHDAACNDCIERGHHIRHVLLAVVPPQFIRERHAVADAAVRVRQKDEVARRCPDLHLVKEGIAVLRLRAAVDFQHERAALALSEARRRQQPAVDRVLVVAPHAESLR